MCFQSSDFLAETSANLYLNRFEISPHSLTNLTNQAICNSGEEKQVRKLLSDVFMFLPSAHKTTRPIKV